MDKDSLRAQFAALATCDESQFESLLAAALVAYDAFFAAQTTGDPIVSISPAQFVVGQQSGAQATFSIQLLPPPPVGQ